MIAIHHRENSFSNKWIEYCKNNNLDYKIVNGFSNSITQELKECSSFLWHWHHGNHDECLAAKYVIYAAENMGLKTYPNSSTCLTFDNKLAQKYQLESIKAPLIPTYIFYNYKDALNWAKNTTWPKVFKLSRGAGSRNVHLVNNYTQAKKFINRAFTTGFKPASGQTRDALIRLRSTSDRRRVDWAGKLKRLPATLEKIRNRNRTLGKDISYIYFQELIPNNKFDIRIIVIGDRAFGLIRNVRKNDFRASGSGNLNFDKNCIPVQCIKIAFNVSAKLNTQSIAFDFVINSHQNPLIVEISYCFPPDFVKNCDGYWDKNLNWHSCDIWPEILILEDLIESINN